MKPINNFSQTQVPAPKEVLVHDRGVPESLKGISHEVRTPLNVIIGICQLLERDQKTPLSPMQRDAVQRMERNAHELLHTVNRLIDSLRRNGNGSH